MDVHADPLVSHRRQPAPPPGEVQRAVSTMAGAALLFRGAARRDLTGWLALAAGGTLIVRSMSGRAVVPRTLLAAAPEEVELVRSITVGARPDEITSLLRDPGRWLSGDIVKGVTVDGDRWRIEYALGPLSGHFDAAVQVRPGEGIAASPASPGSALTGIEVALHEAPDARGCELRASVKLRAGGFAGRSLQTLRGVAERALGHALQRFRQVLETGEVARSQPQPHGRRGLMATVAAAATAKEAS